MDAQPESIDGTAWQPTDVAVIDDIPPQMTCQAHAISQRYKATEAGFAADTEPEDNERQATVKERITVPPNTKEPNIPIREDCANVAGNERQEKVAQSPPTTFRTLCKQTNVRHEQDDPYQTMLSSICTVLPKELQHTPVHDERENKCQS